MYKPYPRQQIAIDKMISFVNKKSSKKGIFVYPTGFGKSIVIANTASAFPDKHFINVAPSQELIKQNYKKFLSYGYEASLCSASLKSNDVGKITFATVGSIKKHLDFYKDKDVVILSDECDEGSKKESTLHSFISGIKKCKVMGTTATPLRLSGGEIKMMNRDNDCFYSSIEDVVQIHEVIDKGYWSELKYSVGKVNTSNLKLNTTGNDFTTKSLKKFSIENNLIERCKKSIEFLQKDGRKHILVFVSSISEAEELQKIIPKCKALHSNTKIISKKQRKEIVSDFLEGRLDVVVQVNILSVGFDFPELDGIVYARPTNSLRIWYQGLGRGVRKHINKQNCRIVDISGNFFKFSKIENITFEDTALMNGWACFSGNNLITGYQLNSPFPPTRASLLRDINMSKEESNFMWGYTFTFGKHNGYTIREVDRMANGKRYLAWMGSEIQNTKSKYTKTFKDKRMLRKALFMYLKIE